MIAMGARYDAQGQYIWVGTVAPGSRDEGMYLGYVDPRTQYHDLAANAPVDMPPKPSELHEFDYGAKAWAVNPETAWMIARIKRDRLLKETDWMVTKAIETGEPMPTGWATHRQALRDVTLQGDPLAIVWPVAPTQG